MPKAIEKCMSFLLLGKLKRKNFKPGLLLVFIDSVHFFKKFIKQLNNFYHLRQELNANDLLKKKEVFPYDYGGSFKNSKKAYPVKINFITH